MSTTQTEWQICAFTEVADYNVGRTPARGNPEYWDQSGDRVPWVTISDMPAHGTVSATKESISATALENVFHGALVPAGTLLMSFKLTIGRVAALGMPAVHNEAIVSIYPKAGMDQRFLGYYLSQLDYSQFQDRQIKGDTLNKAKIDQILVPVPPEPEQEAIADLLDAVRLAIQIDREALESAKALKRAVGHKILLDSSQAHHSAEGRPEEHSEKWVHERLDKSHSVSSGGTPLRSVPQYWNRGTIPWVKTTEIDYSVITQTSEHITQEGLDESAAKMLPVGTVLLAMYGQGVTRGKVAVLGIEAATNQACAAIQPTANAVDSRYLYHYLAYQYHELRQMAHGGQQQNLNLDIVRGFPISYPTSLDAQAKRVELLDALDEKARFHANRIPLLEALFDSLLATIMSNRLRVTEVDTSRLAVADTTEVTPA